MKASEAKELSDSKIPTIDDVMKMVENSAKAGGMRYIDLINFNDELIVGMAKEGYDVKVIDDPLCPGIKRCFISW